MRRPLLALLLLLFGLALPAHADERILAYQSAIRVRADGAMEVTETIQVRAENRAIRHGIYRDFPTDYRDRFGNRVRVDFAVSGALLDGRSEPWHTTREGNGVRVYLGSRDRLLSPGVHRYALSYRTSRQLGMFADHDELYWNVTGNGWAFPIDRATARISLPPGIPAAKIRTAAYTGPRGARGHAWEARVEEDGTVRFATTAPLGKAEGLTIVVAWPKGFVAAPTRAEQAAFLLRDNRDWVTALVGLTLLCGYFLVAWSLVGRDPAAGVIIPLYASPAGLSPAALRFIERMGYDHKAFAAALVNLAVKGAVVIREEDGSFTLERTDRAATDPAAGEQALLNTLFPAGATSLTLRQANHVVIGKALKAHEASLRRDYQKRFFLTNRRWLVPGAILSLLGFASILLTLPDSGRLAAGAFMALWLSIWSIGVIALGHKAWTAWRGVRGGRGLLGALFLSAFCLPFFAGEIAGIWVLAREGSPALPAFLVTAIALNLLFFQLLKAPTRAGRRLLDQVAGFRQYLDLAEKDDLNLQYPLEQTPETFERFLPFALALDVEQRWTERFAEILRDPGGSGRSYRPGWYQGSGWGHHGPTSFSHALGGSLAGAVAASASAPGSSSGMGGGSSGGGGGGGGGGGW